MSKADAIRQAWADPAVKASADQGAADERERAARKASRKIRSLTAKAAGGRAEVDELTLGALAVEIAKLITLDPQANAAVIRELLPPYIASLAR